MSEFNGRRKFLAVALGLVGSVLAGISAWPVLRFLSPGGGAKDAGKVRVENHNFHPAVHICSALMAVRLCCCRKHQVNLLRCRRFVPILAVL